MLRTYLFVKILKFSPGLAVNFSRGITPFAQFAFHFFLVKFSALPFRFMRNVVAQTFIIKRVLLQIYSKIYFILLSLLLRVTTKIVTLILYTAFRWISRKRLCLRIIFFFFHLGPKYYHYYPQNTKIRVQPCSRASSFSLLTSGVRFRILLKLYLLFFFFF